MLYSWCQLITNIFYFCCCLIWIKVLHLISFRATVYLFIYISLSIHLIHLVVFALLIKCTFFNVIIIYLTILYDYSLLLRCPELVAQGKRRTESSNILTLTLSDITKSLQNSMQGFFFYLLTKFVKLHNVSTDFFKSRFCVYMNV